MDEVAHNVFRSVVPSRTLPPYQATNCYWIGRKSVLLVDTGDGSEAGRTRLEEDWRALGSPEVVGVLATHWHRDHTGGGGWAYRRFEAPLYLHSADFRAELGQDPWEDLDRRQWTIDGVRVRVFDAPGHTPGQWNLFLPDSQGLIAGDNVLGNTTVVIAPPDGDLALYLRTLDQLIRLRPEWIGPGHGDIIRDGVDRLEAYRRHRQERIRQLLTLLAESPQEADALSRAIYPPEQVEVGTWMVRGHLAYFVAQGWAEVQGNTYRLRGGIPHDLS